MSIIKITALFFGMFALSRAFLRFRDKSIKTSELALWTFIWGSVLFFSFHPTASDSIANRMGVARGTDITFFLSIIILFYLTFRLYVKIDRVDRNLTMLCGNISKILHKNERKS